MLTALGVPETLEGFVGVQLFKTGRGYAEPVKSEAPALGLDGAVLRLGELPDDYVQLRARTMAQADAILSRLTADTTPFPDRLSAAIERERAEFERDKRPMAILIGWRATAVRRRSPSDKWDWVDLRAEYDRGLALRNEVHDALGRVAAAVSLRFPELLEDWVDTRSFWIAPKQDPVVVPRLGAGGSVEVFATSGEPFPPREMEQWTETFARLPPDVYDAVGDPLRLLAAARAEQSGWLRFTLGWAVLETLAANVGSAFDSQIAVEQRRCPNCGHEISSRNPTLRPRLRHLINALDLPEPERLAGELKRLNRTRGRSHVGVIPEESEARAPERLAAQILEAVVSSPDRIPPLGPH
jgi:hypothetical protein